MTWSYLDLGRDAVKRRDALTAVGWFHRALADQPDDPDAQAWLGRSLCHLGRVAEGAPHLRAAARTWLGPERRRLDRGLEVASDLQKWGDFDSALAALRSLVEAEPDNAQALQMLAAICGQLNLTEAGLEAGARALRLDPRNQMLAVLQGSLEADADMPAAARQRLEAVLADRPGPREAFRAHKELARVLDRLGEHDAVFPHLEAAADLAPQLPEFRMHDPRLVPQLIEQNDRSFDAALLGRWTAADLAGAARAPIFVMGFFRSGTTLTQQVLAAGAGAFVADEAGLIWELRRELQQRAPAGADLAKVLRALDLEAVLELRRRYWELARARYGDDADRPVFVDKFTMNMLDIGLINLVFPDARVVFMLRDPRDVCVSCVMQLMVPSPATIHLLTWRGAVGFYAEAMDFWLAMRERLTIPILEVRYEDATTAFEATYRQLFDALGLDWNPAAEQFHRHAAGKHIASPSRNQVARPLYQSSVGRWRRFPRPIAEAEAILAPLAHDLGYAWR